MYWVVNGLHLRLMQTVMTFKDFNLKKQILNALDDLHFTRPTTIQQKVFSVVMSGADVCGIAQTGTGKTLAYLLPLLNQWKYDKEKDPQILILVPTRELVTQVVETVKKIAVYLSLDVKGVSVELQPVAQGEVDRRDLVQWFVRGGGDVHYVQL